jgi:hydroxymethylpyrimidine/phosphomethylpyrimidine kinase
MVRAQAEQVASFFKLRAVKTGMLYNVEIIEEVAAFLESRAGLPAVVDPVMVSTSGAKLLKDDAIDALRTKLFPRARVVTPNLDEAAVLSGTRIFDVETMERIAMRLSLKHGVPFLLKGGHLPDKILVDVLAIPGAPTLRFAGSRIEGVDTHGSGCTLSAAIAAHLALGCSLEESVAAARDYLRRAMTGALATGGRRFINHFP